MENNIFAKMPVNWTVCMQADCPQHDDCLRYHAFEHINTRHTQQRCVLPLARGGKGCRYHIPFAKVPIAWGMRNLLSAVRDSVIQEMRTSIKAYFKSHSTYYRYFNARYPISPAQQQAIRRIFKRFGYSPDSVHFYRVEEAYFIPRS